MDILSKALHYIGKNEKGTKVIQIGAMDGISYDDIRGYLDMYLWEAILVEPIPSVFKELKENFKDRDNYTFVQAAITTVNGTVEMLTIPTESIEKEDLHGGYKGMSTLFPPKNGFASDYQRDIDVKNNFGVKVKVPSMTLDSLMNKYHVQDFDVFVCDAEGYDWEILQQLDLSKYKPKVIIIEYNTLTQEEQLAARSFLNENGYLCFDNEKDLSGIRKDFLEKVLDWEKKNQEMHPEVTEKIDEDQLRIIEGNSKSNNEESEMSDAEKAAEEQDQRQRQQDIRVKEIRDNRCKGSSELGRMFEKWGTDKFLSEYTPVYEETLEPFRNSIKNVLEIGVGSLDKSIRDNFSGIHVFYDDYKPGGSLRAWRDYFPNAFIHGIDVGEDCVFVEDRIKSRIVDSQDTELANKTFEDNQFDLIIDDGLHKIEAQYQTLLNYFPKVKDGGFYVIEDLGGGGDGLNLFYDWREKVENVIGNHEYFWRGNILVIRKTNSKRGLLRDISQFHEDYDESEVGPKDDLTVVTGLWNIGRPGRSWDHYVESFQQLLEIKQNMFIYIPKEYEYLVWEKRKKSNTFVKTYELSDIHQSFKPHWDKCQEIRTSEEWINSTGENGWLKTSPQGSLEWYNPIVMSKMPMLNDATIWNPFDTNHFIWIDGGITNTVWNRHLVEENALGKITQYLKDFLFLSYPYQSNDEVHGFKADEMNKIAGRKTEFVCRGGLFGGTKHSINQANSAYYSLLSSTLSQGLLGTEESIFTLMAYTEPDRYTRYQLNDNGHILKFIKAMLADDVVFEKVENKRSLEHVPAPIVSIKDLKMSVYMLSFNFPQQVESTIKTWLKHPKWIKNTRNILIDNSTDKNAIAQNEELCKKYNFEHIVTNKNLGINGGRFLAAEHFQASDSDYYLFLEDDMEICGPDRTGFCRNGFRRFVPDLYDKVLKILEGDDVDFVKLSFTEVYMDNNLQVSWYNVPQHIRTEHWPHYDQLPITGIDDNCPRTKFDTIEVIDGLSYIKGQIYYANWPMVVGKKGNQKMFLDITWAHPYEQTWMSQMYQDTIAGKLKPAVLLASPINHNRIVYYKPEERKENAG